MASQNFRLFSAFQVLVLATILLSVCESFSIPMSWGRTDNMPNCPGMMGNRDLYEDLSRICSDCQNIFRGKNVEGKCRSECFGSSYFDTCIMALELAEKMTDYKMHASILKGGRK